MNGSLHTMLGACFEFIHCNQLKYSCKSKAVPLHAMEAHGGRGGIAPTHT
jgi:hypothetical protein